ncbi:hypothetical protein [Anabaena lutea]|uniref:Uncharacterized protein n=1 Tax=Anabaena lutea FACHB-196 TaxID=2692881 RepID=A0ABR8FFS5_9NOST|nr:hypothetical protein [Anabaena lutea]MBD2568493.1 hypothetical protein [Anabaena lutea FACHB-196]
MATKLLQQGIGRRGETGTRGRGENYQLPITNHQSPITNHQSPINNYANLCEPDRFNFRNS